MRTITSVDIESFRIFLYEEEKSKNTLEKYIRDLTVFRDWLCGLEVSKQSVLTYKRAIMETYAPASVNSMLSALNAFFTFMEWFDCKVKTLRIQRQAFANRERELTKKEYERLLCAAKNRSDKKLYYLLQTICSTGIRISELRWITCESVKTGRALIQCKGKVRQILLPKQLCKMLKEYIRTSRIRTGPVFVSKQGNPLDRSYIWRCLKSLCKEASVSPRKVFPHNFRHLFARTYYNIQKDIVRLADILGHSSVNTTRIYTAESGDRYQHQIQRLGLLRC